MSLLHVNFINIEQVIPLWSQALPWKLLYLDLSFLQSMEKVGDVFDKYVRYDVMSLIHIIPYFLRSAFYFWLTKYYGRRFVHIYTLFGLGIHFLSS